MGQKINLENEFRRKLIIDMQTLQRLCKGRSKRSLFRDLSLLGYFSSYSHAGKYYTLTNIPHFDEYGLWHYKDVSFSKNGTLKSTIGFLIADLVTSKIFDIQNTLEIQLFQTKKRVLRTQLDTLDFRADRNFG